MRPIDPNGICLEHTADSHAGELALGTIGCIQPLFNLSQNVHSLRVKLSAEVQRAPQRARE